MNENPELEPSAEFEIVVGRRQMASLAFLAIVALATAAGGSYLVGKATTGQVMAAAPPKNAPAVTAPPTPAPQASPAPVALPVVPERPLFDQPIKGVVYIQMAAVEKGIAEVFAEGLRKRGLDSFVASGPNDRIFRVLIGPFKGGDQYEAAKKALDGMGLDTFARKYEE